jgi:hypothetical protein
VRVFGEEFLEELQRFEELSFGCRVVVASVGDIL